MQMITLILAAIAAVGAVLAMIFAMIAVRRPAQGSGAENLGKDLSQLKGQIETLQNAQGQLLKQQSDALNDKLDIFSKQVNTLSGNVDTRMETLRKTQDERLEQMRQTLEQKVQDMQSDNRRQLDSIRDTVNEKLTKTLNDRISESFKNVSQQLEQVYKGLGEMQQLANGVGDLKRVLSNVKTRGILGEIQLERILEQILQPAQYDTNVITKKGSRGPVEFAVKIPSKTSDDFIYLPIDAKFPLEKYARLEDALEQADAQSAEDARKELRQFIRDNAKKIQDKYIDPPHTTDFAVMFLPTEGLYAEVIRQTELVEQIARDYKVTLSGPSTVSALLNSLQMGFRTLAIEKRSNEVWTVLGAVKTEFGKFNTALQGVQKRMRQADEELDKLISTRTNQIMRKLRGVEQLPEQQSAEMFDRIDASDADDTPEP